MSLTPEERQRIYEEEKARREAQDRLSAEKRRRRGIGCLSVIGGLVVLGIVLSVIGSLMTPSSRQSTSSSTEPDARGGSSQTTVPTKEELLKNIETVNAGLRDMNTGIAGKTMEHIKLSLEVFNAAALLIQKSQADQLTDDERAKVAELRKNLVLRQRQAFPVIRDKVGPLISNELWMSDGKARTFGNRFTTIEFIGASFAANANIAKAHEAILALLVRMRFKGAQYKWYSEQEDYTYYKIDSPSDGAVAIIDLEGKVTLVPE
jgi:hypothetical protein